jgi:hypothetical protein
VKASEAEYKGLKETIKWLRNMGISEADVENITGKKAINISAN